MKNLILFIAILLLLIIQNGILLPLRLFPVNLLLIFVGLVTVLSDFDSGLFVALVSAILLQLISSSIYGSVGFIILMLFLSLYFILNSFITREPNLIILFSSVVGTTVVYFVAQSFVIRNFSFKELFFSLLFNLIFTYPVLRFYLFAEKLTPKHEKSVSN